MTQGWAYHNPVRIHAGRGKFDQLGAQLAPGLWLLVTTAGATRRGLTARLQQQLGDDHALLVCDSITPNPTLDELDSLTAAHAGKSIVGIVSVGGGSALDAAKVLSVTLLACQDTPLARCFRDGAAQSWSARLPVVAVPTTSGTGSEVTPFATVWDDVRKKKYSVAGDLLFPVLAVLDPGLTLTLPARETLYTALDATSHALESLWNRNRTPISEAFAWQALQLVVEHLPVVLDAPDNLDAREGMQRASLLAGLAISQTRTALAHSISYPLTSRYQVPHGLACSFTLRAILEQYLTGHLRDSERALLVRVHQMLGDLDLPHELQQYLGAEDVLALAGEMHTPERAGNLAIHVDVEQILRQSVSQ